MLKEDDPKYYENCLKIHGYKFTDSDSDEGKSESDEESRSMKPPPVPYNQFRDRIIKLDDNKTRTSAANTIQVAEKSFDIEKNTNVLIPKTTQKIDKLVINRKGQSAKTKIISKPSTSTSRNPSVFDNYPESHLQSSELRIRQNVFPYTKIEDLSSEDWRQATKTSVGTTYSENAGGFPYNTAKIANEDNIVESRYMKPSPVQYDELRNSILNLYNKPTQNSIARKGNHDIEVNMNRKIQNTNANILMPPILHNPNNLAFKISHNCILNYDQRSNELPVNQYTFFNNKIDYNSHSRSSHAERKVIIQEISTPAASINTNEDNNSSSFRDGVNCNFPTENSHANILRYQNTISRDSERMNSNQPTNDESSSLCSWCTIL